MKKNIALTLLISVFILLTSFLGWAAVPQTAEEHLAMANSYFEKAKAQENLIAEHQKMKADYANEIGFTPKMKRLYAGKIESMEKHCDAIIQKARELDSEFSKMAEWHQMRARELQGE